MRTKELTENSLLERKRDRLIDKLGNVKYFIFLCAEKYDWTFQDFVLEKSDLREKYDISKKKIPEVILNSSQDELIAMLLEVLRSQYT